jgi:hypothetical protein
MFGTIVTVAHLSLCLIMSYGVLFSRTPETAFATLTCLVALLVMIRFFKGCIMTDWEQDLCTSKMGRSFMVLNYKQIPIGEFEEIVVGALLITTVIRVYTLLIVPSDVIFD